MSANPNQSNREGSQAFYAAFYVAVGLTVCSLLTCCWLVAMQTETDVERNLFETCSTTWKMGFGAIVGLIGGRRLTGAGGE